MDASRDCDRSDLEVGITAWVFQSRERYVRFKLYDFLSFDRITDSDSEAFGMFRQLVPASAVQTAVLEKMGQHAKSKGIARISHPRMIQVYAGRYVSLRPAVPTNWAELENVFPADRMLADDRFTSWENNSCAFDVALFFMRILNSGLIKADVMRLSKLRSLTLTEHALLLYMNSPHQKISPELRNCYREAFRRAFLDDPHSGYCGDGDYFSPNDIFNACARVLGQMTYTAATRYVCCDGIEMVDATQCATQHTMITISLASAQHWDRPHGRMTRFHQGQTVSDIITATAFGSKKGYEANMIPSGLASRLTPCPKGARCRQMYETVIRVLSGFPARLYISLGWGSPVSDRYRRYFDNYSTSTRVNRGESGEFVVTAVYEVVCVAFCRNANHFFGRAKDVPKHEGVISHHDGIMGDGVKEFKSWDQGLKPSDRVVTIILERIEEKVGLVTE